MTDETENLEPIEEESAPQQEEGAPEQAAEPEVEEVVKEPPDTKALREARRDAKKLERKLKRSQADLQRARQQVSRQFPAQPTGAVDEQQVIQHQAAMYRQGEQERFVGETLSRLGLERDDPRLDYYSPETFTLSATAAKEEDFQEREAELAEKEEKLESLGDRLRAEAKERLDREIRDFRREVGLDKVAKVTPAGEGGTTEAEIRAKYKPQLDALKGKGSTGEVMVLIREMEAEIAKERTEQ